MSNSDWKNSTEGLPDGMERTPFNWSTATPMEKVRRRWGESCSDNGRLVWTSPNEWMFHCKHPFTPLSECPGYLGATWEEAASHPSVLELEREETAARRAASSGGGDQAPLECTQCDQPKGPIHPIDADHVGWMCDECYARLQSAPIEGKGFEEWWNKYALTPKAHSDSQRDARSAWSAALAFRDSQPATAADLAESKSWRAGMDACIAQAKREGLTEALEAVKELRGPRHEWMVSAKAVWNSEEPERRYEKAVNDAESAILSKIAELDAEKEVQA